jgi:S1-C subfamily serine protease
MSVLQPPTPTSPVRSPRHRLHHGSLTTIALLAAIVITGSLLILMALAGLGARSIRDSGAAATGSGSVNADGSGPLAAVSPATGSAISVVDVSAIASDVVNGVVRVEIQAPIRGQSEIVGSGSGVIVDSGGTIVTNAHVVEAGSSFEVVLTNGDVLEAAVLGLDTADDLALLHIDMAGLTPITLGETASLQVGDPVIAVGNPLGLEGGPSVSTGIISALNRTLQDSGITLSGIIQTDAAMTQGSSGGALLDANGRLIGITTAVGVSSVGIEGIGFAIPVETITQAITAMAG